MWRGSHCLGKTQQPCRREDLLDALTSSLLCSVLAKWVVRKNESHWSCKIPSFDSTFYFRQGDWAESVCASVSSLLFNNYMAKKTNKQKQKNSGNKNNKFNKVTELNGSGGGGSWQVLPGQLAYTSRATQVHDQTRRLQPLQPQLLKPPSHVI